METKTKLIDWHLIPGQVTVITTTDIKKDEVITEFTGKYILDYNSLTEKEKEYSIAVSDNLTLCGLYATKGHGHLINNVYGKKRKNCYFELDIESNQVYVKALVSIPKNTELLTTYGHGYWKSRQKF